MYVSTILYLEYSGIIIIIILSPKRLLPHPVRAEYHTYIHICSRQAGRQAGKLGSSSPDSSPPPPRPRKQSKAGKLAECGVTLVTVLYCLKHADDFPVFLKESSLFGCKVIRVSEWVSEWVSWDGDDLSVCLCLGGLLFCIYKYIGKCHAEIITKTAATPKPKPKPIRITITTTSSSSLYQVPFYHNYGEYPQQRRLGPGRLFDGASLGQVFLIPFCLLIYILYIYILVPTPCTLHLHFHLIIYIWYKKRKLYTTTVYI